MIKVLKPRFFSQWPFVKSMNAYVLLQLWYYVLPSPTNVLADLSSHLPKTQSI